MLGYLSEKTEFICELDTSASTYAGSNYVTLELAPTRTFNPRGGRVWHITLRTDRGSLEFKYQEDMEIFLNTCCTGLKFLGTDYYSITGYCPLTYDNPPDLQTVLSFLATYGMVGALDIQGVTLLEKLRLSEGLRQIYSSSDLDDLRFQVCG